MLAALLVLRRAARGERTSRACAPLSSERSTTDDLVAVRRVVDDELEHEAVDLGLGQRVGALGLDRVLRGEHEERRRHVVRVVADRDLALLHHLEQRRLHLGGRAVDLVREQEVAEHRAELGVEAAGVRPEDPRADEVGGHEVGRELQPLERAAEHVGDGLDRQRLGQPGHALQQHVASGQERHEHALEHRLLADDHPLDLEERRLERVVGVPRRVRLQLPVQRVEPPLLWGHVLSPGFVISRPRVGAGAKVHCQGTPVAAADHRHFAFSPGLRASTAAETSSEDWIVRSSIWMILSPGCSPACCGRAARHDGVHDGAGAVLRASGSRRPGRRVRPCRRP